MKQLPACEAENPGIVFPTAHLTTIQSSFATNKPDAIGMAQEAHGTVAGEENISTEANVMPGVHITDASKCYTAWTSSDLLASNMSEHDTHGTNDLLTWPLFLPDTEEAAYRRQQGQEFETDWDMNMRGDGDADDELGDTDRRMPSVENLDGRNDDEEVYESDCVSDDDVPMADELESYAINTNSRPPGSLATEVDAATADPGHDALTMKERLRRLEEKYATLFEALAKCQHRMSEKDMNRSPGHSRGTVKTTEENTLKVSRALKSKHSLNTHNNTGSHLETRHKLDGYGEFQGHIAI